MAESMKVYITLVQQQEMFLAIPSMAEKIVVEFAGLYLIHFAKKVDIAFMKKDVLHVKSASSLN